MAVLTVLWIGFCLTAPILLCADSSVFVYFVFFCHLLMCCVIVSRGGVDLMGLKPYPYDLSSFSALTLSVGPCDP